jgi:putative hydrolase of the HAD superfamily
MSKFNVVLFDLGGTLVEYYKASEFPDILEHAMNDIQQLLFEKMAVTYEQDELWHRVEEESHEYGDFRVKPMEDRLVNIFQLKTLKSPDFITSLCQMFLKHIFEKGHVFEDTKPVLQELMERGLKMGLVSNTPWGAPAFLWREELERLGLVRYFNAIIFCRDVGWRKPASQVFTRAFEMLRTDQKSCIFVGDDPKWDISGPRAVGMDAVLLDRSGEKWGSNAIASLRELLVML